MKKLTSIPALTLIAVLLGGALFYYVQMNIKVALLNRKIERARSEVRDWERKNSALKAELARIGGEGYEQLYFKLYGALPLYEENQVVRIRLPETKKRGLFGNPAESKDNPADQTDTPEPSGQTGPE